METRRKFIEKIIKGTCALTLASRIDFSGAKHFNYFGKDAYASTPASHEALYYTKMKNTSVVECSLCPWMCRVPDGSRGLCKVRENRAGTYYTLNYGKPCTIHTDPIEKKPLYHYLPGTNAFSLATAGCNMGCEFCQNWRISQFGPEEVQSIDMPPKNIITAAKKSGAPTIAYTYSEPVIFYEYMRDIAQLARQENIGNVMISNGFIQKEPMKILCKDLTAVKIDFKGFTNTFYRKVCHGELEPVKDTLLLLKEIGIWFEIVVLIVPTLNDSSAEITEMCRWIYKELGPDVPVHFSRYYPTYKIVNIPPTPIRTLERARKIAMDSGMHFAYTGNLPGLDGENTFCPNCKKAIIKRVGYFIESVDMKDGHCAFCGQAIPGVWSQKNALSWYTKGM